MCGHVGVINLSTRTRTDLSTFIKEAVVVGTLRGNDSIGIGQICADRTTVDVHKTMASPTKLLASMPGAAITDQANTAFVTMVHHRAATIGAVTKAAAQPFHYLYGPFDARKNVLVAHNGTLTNHDLGIGSGSFVSDSDWLAYQIAAADIDETTGLLDIAKSLSAVEGSYSVVVATESQAYFANNGKRPMIVAVSVDRECLFYASEAGMLDWLLKRNNISTSGVIIELAPYKLYTVPLTSKTISVDVSDIEELAADDYGDSYWGPYRSYASGYKSYRSSASPPPSLDSWYERVTGSKPEEVRMTAKLPVVAAAPAANVSYHSVSAGVTTAQAQLAGRAINFMRKKHLTCMFDEYDPNLKEAYGIGWASNADIAAADTELRRFIDSCGAVVRGLTRDQYNDVASFNGTITGFRWVPEVTKGVMTTKPYFVIDPDTLTLNSTPRLLEA